MRISSRSWHYRYLRFVWWAADLRDTFPSNLCEYCWALAFSPLFLLGVGMLWLGLGLVVIFLYLPVTLAGVAWNHSWQRWRGRVSEPAEPRESIVLAYLKAKKDKICPTLTFVEEADAR